MRRWRLRGKIVNTFLSFVSERKTQRAETKYDIRGYQVDQHLIFLDRSSLRKGTCDISYTFTHSSSLWLREKSREQKQSLLAISFIVMSAAERSKQRPGAKFAILSLMYGYDREKDPAKLPKLSPYISVPAGLDAKGKPMAPGQ